MHNNQELEPYQPPSPASNFVQLILGMLILLLVLVGLIAGWHTFLRAAPIMVQVLVVLVVVAVPVTITSAGIKKGYISFTHMRKASIELHMAEEQLEALRDARRRENEQHTPTSTSQGRGCLPMSGAIVPSSMTSGAAR